MTHTREKVKFNGHSVQKLQWKRTDGSDCITSRANAVGIKCSLTYCVEPGTKPRDWLGRMSCDTNYLHQMGRNIKSSSHCTQQYVERYNLPVAPTRGRSLKLAFHDADTDTEASRGNSVCRTLDCSRVWRVGVGVRVRVRVGVVKCQHK